MLAHLGVMALGLVVSSADGGARRLNAPLPRAPGGDVVQERYTPDGARLVFRADREQDEVFELYGVPAGGGTPVKLNGPLDPGADVLDLLWITPDGARVLFVAATDRFAVGRLFSVPVDGSAPAVELALGRISSSSLRVSHDGTFVVLAQGGNLVARAIDASAPAFQLDPTFPSGRVFYFALSPTANRVVYVANPDGAQVLDLFSVDIVPGALPIQLDPPLTSGSLASYLTDPFQISPDGRTVVYRADQQTDDEFELFSVPIGGGTAVLLSGSVAAGSSVDVLDFAIDPTSSRVVFDASPDGWLEALYSVPLDGSSAPVELYPQVDDWQIDPTGRRVVFHHASLLPYDPRTDLWSRAIDGSSPTVWIGLETGPFLINRQGTRVAFHFTDRYASGSWVISTPIDTSSGAAWIPTGGVEHSFEFTPDGDALVYQSDLDVPWTTELFTVPASNGVPRKLNDPLPGGGHVERYHVHPSGGAVSFVADLAQPSVFEVFSAPLAGGANVRQSGVMPSTNLLGSVSAFRTANRRAVYIAHPGDPAHARLFGVSFAGGANARALGESQLVDPLRLELTPDGERVLYLTTNTSPTGDVELFSASTDASSPPVQLGGDLEADGASLPFRLGPRGMFVAFLSDRRTEDVRELFAGPTDGSFAAVRLSGALVAGGDVVDFALVPGRRGLVYLADQSTDEVFELFSRSLPSPPVRVSGPLTFAGDVTSFQVSPDGNFVVYLADQTANDVFELFRSPIDGSSAPVRLNTTLPLGGDVVSFQLGPDGTRVVYLADQLVNGRNELFSAPSDASSSAVRLNDQLPSNGGVLDGYQPRSGIVVFGATVSLGGVGLFAAPIDGSTPAIPLASPFGTIGDLQSFQLTTDGTRALFISGPGASSHLHGVPTDGSSDPYRIDVGPRFAGHVYDFRISPDGAQVVFQAATDDDDIRELFGAQTDGTSTPRRLNRPLGSLGDVAPDFALTPDGTAVLFRAEDQDPDAFELFLSTIDGHIAGAAAPGQ